jgi:hypothetical protein
MENGGQMTLGALTAVGTDIGLSNSELKTFLPPSVTDNSTVVYKSADGTPVTLGNIDSIVNKNPSFNFTTVLDGLYKTGKLDFKSEITSPVVTPPAVTPPVVTPPEVTPPAVTPPVVTPPAVTPPVVTPPVVTPPAVTPPEVTPPAVTPTEVAPPVVTPPAVTPPVVTPPAVTPPVVTPPAASVTIDNVTQAISNAIAGIKFPAGISVTDVANQIKAAMTENPGLSAADVTKSITDYMAANPGLTAADVSTAITNATSNFVTNASLEAALAGMSADAKNQFETLTQGQKDIVASQVQMGTDINTAITNAATQTANQIAGVKTDISNLSSDVKTKFENLTQGQKDIVASQVQMGTDLSTAIDNVSKQSTEQIAAVKTDLTKNITDVQTQFNTRVDELVLQGKTYQEATQEALKELGTGVTGLQTSVSDIQKQQAEEAAAKKAAADKARVQGGLSAAMAMIAPAAASAVSEDTPYRQIGLKTTGEAKFESPLEQYLKMVKEDSYVQKPTQPEPQQQNQQVAPVQDELSIPQQQPQQGSDYFNYGQQTDINDLLGGSQTSALPFKAGGLATPLFAGGGTTRYGQYAGGGLNVVHHSGKPRLDFRTGNAVTGPGDGQSDDIPAMLADGEFVFPADVVAALGNGSTKAGSDKLYDMMHSIRAYHRSAKPQDLPPPAKKSPLDYLKKPARKARR